MTEIFAKLLRTVFVAGIALLGMLMAVVLLVSTVAALAVVYVAARLRGKPFAAGAYWKRRTQARWRFGEAADAAPQPKPRPGYTGRVDRRDIVDVEMRDIPS